MDRRTVLFIVLSLGIWYGWLLLFPPPEKPDPAAPDPTVTAPEPVTPAPVAPVPDPDAGGPEVRRPELLCGSDAVWSNRGGGLSDLTLRDYKGAYHVTPLYSWVLGGFGPWSPYGDDPGPARILTPEASAFAIGAGDLLLPPPTLTAVGLGGTGNTQGLAVRQDLQHDAGDPCHFLVTYSWTNTTGSPYAGPVWVSAHDALPTGGGGMMSRYTSQSGASALIDGGVWTLSSYDSLEGPKEVDDGAAGWFGIADRYFAAYLVPEEAHGRILQTRVQRSGRQLDGLHWVTDATIAPGETHTEVFKLYVGPKDLDAMRAVHDDLGLAVELGWFSFFARPLLWMLKLFYMAVGNWGLAIIALTFTVKIIFFPLTQSAFKSGQAMQSIQPALQEIRETYADDQEELNRRTMELFRENKVNPVGGCLPMLIQFPVWIALYNVLLSSVELYQTEFLYLRDLSSVDPYGVLPVIVVALIMIQQQFTPTGNMDPAQARMMKFMPLMFGIFFFTFPSGLVVYIFVNTVLSVLQQWFIKRTYAPPAPAVA
ncbi:MAG: membrane protein insertase YidC [Myxococcota bacterium]